jgi:hypothetical protein
MTTAVPPSRTLLTGFRIVFGVQVMALPVSLVMTWSGYRDPYDSMHQDLMGAFLSVLGFNAMCFLAGCSVALQRVRLDWAGRKIACANIETFYRWREFDVADIHAVTFQPSAKTTKAMVDRLWLDASVENKRGGLYLLDSRITPLFKRRPSPLFVAVVGFIRELNPKASLPLEFD